MEFPLAAKSQTVDIGALLDRSAFTFLQKWVVALAAASVISAGLDVTLIGFVIPEMSRQWGILGKGFAPAVTAGMIGMVIGSAYAGMIADKLGRRRAVIGSVLVFGLATACVSLAHGIGSLGLFLFFSGVGISGALPTFSTLVAEFTPARLRTIAVTCTIVCVSCGGMFAGLIAATVLPAYGWPVLFLIGGAIPIVLCVLLFFSLPESPRFLARDSNRWPELARLVARMSQAAGPETQFTDCAEAGIPSHVRMSALLSHEFRRDTLALWTAFLVCLFSIYTIFNWLPTMLVFTGVASTNASLALAAWNAGGVAGAVVVSLIIARFGSRWPLIGCCALGSLTTLAAAQPTIASHFRLLMAALIAYGFFINAVQSTLFALCAFVYPTPIRARGVACAVSLGQVGAVLAGIAGALALSSSSTRFYLMLSGALLLVLTSLATIRRHIPANR